MRTPVLNEVTVRGKSRAKVMFLLPSICTVGVDTLYGLQILNPNKHSGSE